MFCPGCGAPVPAESNFCRKCGRRINLPVSNVAPDVRVPIPPPIPSGMPDDRNRIPVENLFRRPAVITFLAILNAIGGVLFLLATIAYGGFFLHKVENLIAAGIIGGILFMLAFMTLVCALGLWKLRSYGRTSQIVLALIGLPAIPLGTTASILILIYMCKPEVAVLFSGKNTRQLNSMEAEQLSSLQLSGSTRLAVAIMGTIAGFVCLLAIIGLLVASRLPSAGQRAKQLRTMADMRAIGTACESYAVYANSYPDVDTIDELARHLEPNYIRRLPRQDAWEHSFHYSAWSKTGSSGQMDSYMIVSAGKHGILEQKSFGGYPLGKTADLNNDIVFSNGYFRQYPQSIPVDEPSPDFNPPSVVVAPQAPRSHTGDVWPTAPSVPAQKQQEEEPDPDHVFRITAEVRQPVLIRAVRPGYPEDARKARTSGLVIAEALIEKDGSVSSVKVLFAAHPAMGDSAIRAIKQWKYEPATRNGRPVRVYFQITVTFTSDGEVRF